MARICDFSWKGTQSGNTRSHSMRSHKRSFKVNLIKKKVKLEDGSTLKIKVSSTVYKKLKGFI